MAKVSKPVLIFAIVAALFLVYILFFTGTKKPPVSAKVPATTTAAVTPASGSPGIPAVTEKSMEVRPNFGKLQLAWKRDPFQIPGGMPTASIGKAGESARLVAIIDGAKGRFAIIGSEVVAKGGLVAGARVVDIGRDSAVLDREGSRITLLLDRTGRADFPITKREGRK
jgi:hypothetical protein